MGVVLGRRRDKMVGVMLGRDSGFVRVIGVMLGGGGGGNVGWWWCIGGVVGLMLGWGVELCCVQKRLNRPIIYLNVEYGIYINDVYITVTVYQYYGNCSTSQTVYRLTYT